MTHFYVQSSKSIVKTEFGSHTAGKTDNAETAGTIGHPVRYGTYGIHTVAGCHVHSTYGLLVAMACKLAFLVLNPVYTLRDCVYQSDYIFM